MKFASWNIRGVGSTEKCTAIRNLVRTQKVEVLLLQETKKEVWTSDEVRKLWHHDEFEFRMAESSGRSGALITILDRKALLRLALL
ncbi:hypothetical protein V6N11_046711 [Hibiscus sabdariffa]|uniref:Endonuclease/exonuclease/phosphatase domain-containing protein n=1 Tax=Hibiscus sabdariffa TaxID=183260 RepID=A0ABR2NGN3_9ROSI